MPIYVYKCDEGHIFEMLQNINDPPTRECKECGAPVKKALTSAGLIGQTSGFSGKSVTPEATARFKGAKGGKGQMRKEEVFVQKMPGFDKRAAKRKKSKGS
jgi:putative FmdB family regulatory protein